MIPSNLGPDAPITTNTSGAKQSAVDYRLDLIPPLALLDVAHVLDLGAKKYGIDNWRGIPVEDHINHALIHIYAYLSGDSQDNHLGHAACRLLMAKEQELKQQSHLICSYCKEFIYVSQDPIKTKNEGIFHPECYAKHTNKA